MDLGLPPDPDGVSEGFATLDGLARQMPNTKVIVATSHGDRTHALRAIAGGAYDFCEKPIDIDMLGTIVARSLRLRTLEDENRRLSEMPSPSPIKRIVTADPGMLKVCRDIEKLAAANVSALLLGESGTGKEALARGAARPRTARAPARSSPSTAARSPRRCWKASCSATSAGRSPAPSSRRSARSSWRIRGPCSWMRSATCRSSSR